MIHAKKKSMKLFTGIIMSLMMIAAMMPGAAFAQSVDEGYDVDILETELNISTAATTTVTATTTAPAGKVVHIDWSSSDTGIATVGRHKGNVAPQSEGTVTLTATLRAGNPEESGTGHGSAGGCSGQVLATDTVRLNITAESYGLQGDGDNQLKLTNPADIITLAPGTLDGKKKYNNKIKTPVSEENGTISFDYTMSAGMNNFKEETFDFYKDDIGIYDKDGNKTTATIDFGGFADKTVAINADVTSLSSGNYILRFGPSVCGNNHEKKLDCYIDFTFVLRQSAAKTIDLDKTSATLDPGQSLTLTAELDKDEKVAANDTVSWTSSDSEVASVDENGKVTANKAGKAIITAAAVYGNVSAICVITVNGTDEPVVAPGDDSAASSTDGQKIPSKGSDGIDKASTDQPADKSAETGDEMSIGFYIAWMLAAACAGAVVVAKGRTCRRKQ